MKTINIREIVGENGSPNIYVDPSQKDFSKKAPALLADEIAKTGIIVFDDTDAHIRTQTHYQRITDKNIPRLIPQLLDPSIRTQIPTSCITECVKRLTLLPELQTDLTEEFWKNQNLLNLQNGVYDIMTQQLRERKPEDKFNYILNFNYQPNCKLDDVSCFKKFLETSLDEEGSRCLLFVLAYCLSSLTQAEKAFILLGNAKTGTSTILNLLQSVTSPDLVSNEPFHLMGSERSKAKYTGKRINISRENSSIPMKHEDSFKSLISNEETYGRNLYESGKYFQPPVKFIFAFNGEPNFTNPDDAIYDKMIVIPFNKEIKLEDRDIDLGKEMIENKDIIFSIIIDNLKELVESGYDFHESKEAKEYIQQHRTFLHSVEDFLDENTVLDAHSGISSTELNKLYEEWCHANNIPAIGRNYFYKHIRDYSKEIQYGKVVSRNGRVNGFNGLRIKSKEEMDAFYASNFQTQSNSDVASDIATDSESSMLTNLETTTE
ncbi:MAG: phage/plasmid primase, P4 family [Oscillospiraceae bacterium]